MVFKGIFPELILTKKILSSYKMLKGRRSSTPSQKEKEKSSGEKNKKQQRSASTSAIKNNNTINTNSSSTSFSYSMPSDNGEILDKESNKCTNNNVENSESGNIKHWSKIVCETVLLVLNEGDGLHFKVAGGADEGRFPYIGSQCSSAEDSGVTVQSLSPTGKNKEFKLLL